MSLEMLIFPFGAYAAEMGVDITSSFERIKYDYSEMDIQYSNYDKLAHAITESLPTNGNATLKISYITSVVSQNPDYDPETEGSEKYLFVNTINHENDQEYTLSNIFMEADDYEVKWWISSGSGEPDDAPSLFIYNEGIIYSGISCSPPFSDSYYFNSFNLDLDEIFEELPEGTTTVDLFTPLFEVTINYLYSQSKLDAKYIDGVANSYKEPLYAEDGELSLIYSPKTSSSYASYLTTQSCWSSDSPKFLAVDKSALASALVGSGLTCESEKLKVNYATRETVGGIRYYLDGDQLYITTNGNDPKPA